MMQKHHWTRGQNLSVFVATGCRVGMIPIAPGTFGTLWGLPLAWGMSQVFAQSWVAAVLVALAFIVLSVWSSDVASQALGSKDPGSVVIDEVAGYMVTLFAIPFSWKAALAGFVFFRIFDILKPVPVSTLDKKVKGGLGIVADDLMAGIYAHVALRIFLHYF